MLKVWLECFASAVRTGMSEPHLFCNALRHHNKHVPCATEGHSTCKNRRNTENEWDNCGCRIVRRDRAGLGDAYRVSGNKAYKLYLDDWSRDIFSLNTWSIPYWIALAPLFRPVIPASPIRRAMRHNDRSVEIRVTIFGSYKALWWSAYHRVALSPDPEVANFKFVPNKNENLRTKAESKLQSALDSALVSWFCCTTFFNDCNSSCGYTYSRNNPQLLYCVVLSFQSLHISFQPIKLVTSIFGPFGNVAPNYSYNMCLWEMK
jgi:hypothetical protein